MFYLRKTKPIKLNLYTDNLNAYELFKPSVASDFVPEWKSNKDDEARHCYGLRSMFQSGFFIPLWSDLIITATQSQAGEINGSFEFADQRSILQMQTLKTSVVPSNKVLFKMESPWFCECEEDVKFIVAENMWSNPNRGAEFMSGVLDFKYQHATNLFFYIEKKEQVLNMKSGDTPVLFRHLSERKLNINCSYDPDRLKFLQNRISSPFFTQRHTKRMNLMRKKHGNT